MSPPPASSGPRDENDAVNGAGASKTIVDALIVAVAPAVAAYALIARPLALSTVHRRDEVEVGVERAVRVVVEHHPDAARLLHREALVDASRDAALADDDLAGDLRRVEDGGPGVVRGCVAELDLTGSAPARPAAVESISGAGPIFVATDAPV